MNTPAPIRSNVLDRVPHAFSTRVGGVSGGMFASLNFGNPGDLPAELRDPPANIAENFARLTRAMGPAAQGRTIRQVHQVHGDAVVVIRPGQPWPERDPQADAMVSDDPGVLLAVRVADCAPILLASADGRVVGAVHAGWRGTIAGVLTRAIDAMRSLGAKDLAAAIGPCIGPGAFEVGPEVAEQFARHFGPGLADRPHPASAGKALVDLPAALAAQLRQAGVARIDADAPCTFADAGRFFSHRRDAGRTGRLVGVIGCAG
jgi:YfiH family protein